MNRVRLYWFKLSNGIKEDHCRSQLPYQIELQYRQKSYHFCPQIKVWKYPMAINTCIKTSPPVAYLYPLHEEAALSSLFAVLVDPWPVLLNMFDPLQIGRLPAHVHHATLHRHVLAHVHGLVVGETDDEGQDLVLADCI